MSIASSGVTASCGRQRDRLQAAVGEVRVRRATTIGAAWRPSHPILGVSNADLFDVSVRLDWQPTSTWG